MPKRQCAFHFIDEAQYRCAESREHAAHLLRAWRKHSKRYVLQRKALGVYEVRTSGSSAVALLETRV